MDYFIKYRSTALSIISLLLFIWYISTLWNLNTRLSDAKIEVAKTKKKLKEINIIVDKFNSSVYKIHDIEIKLNQKKEIVEKRKIIFINIRNKINSNLNDVDSLTNGIETKKIYNLINTSTDNVNNNTPIVKSIADSNLENNNLNKKQDIKDTSSVKKKSITPTRKDFLDKLICQKKNNNDFIFVKFFTIPQKENHILSIDDKTKYIFSQSECFIISNNYSKFFMDVISKKSVFLNLININREIYTTNMDINSVIFNKCTKDTSVVEGKLKIEIDKLPIKQNLLAKKNKNKYFILEKAILLKPLDNLKQFLDNSNPNEFIEYKKEFYPIYNDILKLSLNSQCLYEGE